MTEQQFRRLTREELIEIIYELQKKQAQMEQENERLRQALSDRQIKIENAGSIAEASLALNGVFEAAQAAADQYLEQIRAASETSQQLCDRLVANAQRRACAIVAQAQQEAKRLLGTVDADEAQAFTEAQEKTDTALKAYEALRDCLQE